MSALIHLTINSLPFNLDIKSFWSQELYVFHIENRNLNSLRLQFLVSSTKIFTKLVKIANFHGPYLDVLPLHWIKQQAGELEDRHRANYFAYPFVWQKNDSTWKDNFNFQLLSIFRSNSLLNCIYFSPTDSDFKFRTWVIILRHKGIFIKLWRKKNQQESTPASPQEAYRPQHSK